MKIRKHCKRCVATDFLMSVELIYSKTLKKQ